MDHYAKASAIPLLLGSIMAKYRLIRTTKGNYDLQGILEKGGEKILIVTELDVLPDQISAAATRLAATIGETRKALKLAGGNPR